MRDANTLDITRFLSLFLVNHWLLIEVWMAVKNMAAADMMHYRYSDRATPPAKGHIARLSFLLASILIVLASISLAFIGLVASREADRQASSNQQQLLDIALKNRFALMARDQLSLARWDESVLKISQSIERDFINDEFMDSLWFDFGLHYNLLIGPNNTVLAEAFEENVEYNDRQLSFRDPLYQLAENARASFFEYRVAINGGYGQQLIAKDITGEVPTQGFLMFDDQPAIVNAMAIVPDDGEYVLPEGNPVILISAILLDQGLISNLNDQLSFSNLEFVTPELPSSHLPQHTISSLSGEILGSFLWIGAMPGQQIWRTVIPVVIVLGAFLALVAFGIAWKIGRLTLSLATSEHHNLFLAMHDTLSGLANRLQFNRALEGALENLPNLPFTLIQCDLDHFKKVNDTLGHAAGDTVIQSVAKRLTQIVGEEGLVGRVGGDEFVVLLPGSNERAHIKHIANQMIADICIPIETDSGEMAQVGISLGIAFAPVNGITSETIMAAADNALYIAKEQGRNRAVFAGTIC